LADVRAPARPTNSLRSRGQQPRGSHRRRSPRTNAAGRTALVAVNSVSPSRYRAASVLPGELDSRVQTRERGATGVWSGWSARPLAARRRRPGRATGGRRTGGPTNSAARRPSPRSPSNRCRRIGRAPPSSSRRARSAAASGSRTPPRPQAPRSPTTTTASPPPPVARAADVADEIASGHPHRISTTEAVRGCAPASPSGPRPWTMPSRYSTRCRPCSPSRALGRTLRHARASPRAQDCAKISRPCAHRSSPGLFVLTLAPKFPLQAI
jgi:hypothetical protein